MKKQKLIAGAMALLTAVSFTACKSDKAVNTASIDPDASYPLETDQTLTIWGTLGEASTQYATGDDLPYYQELQKLTGVKLKFVHPPAGQVDEKLKIMLSSGDVADIIHYNFASKYSGGAEKAISDGHIISLNDYLDTYAKDYKKALEEYPDAARYAKTVDGEYYTFAQIKADEGQSVYYGPIVRQDWLDELNLSLPETIDEWYTVLKAFKEKKNASDPLIITYDDLKKGMFFGAYGVAAEFYVDDGKVKYGPMEDGYLETLKFLKKLYDEKLITDNITGIERNVRNSKVLNGECGAILGYMNSDIRSWLNNSSVKGTSFSVVATKWPVVNKGEKSIFSAVSDLGFPCKSISALSPNKELAAKFLNFGYTEEGIKLYQYGIEGQSYEVKDGQPKYTDLVYNNPDGLTLSQALSVYAHCGDSDGSIRTMDSYIQTIQEPELQDAMAKWVDTDVKEHKLPIESVPEQYSSEYASIYSDISTYVSESFYKFVMGIEPLENFDEFRSQLKKMNIERLIEIKQEVYNKTK